MEWSGRGEICSRCSQKCELGYVTWKVFGSLEDGSLRVLNKGVILTDSLKQSSGCCENTVDYRC